MLFLNTWTVHKQTLRLHGRKPFSLTAKGLRITFSGKYLFNNSKYRQEIVDSFFAFRTQRSTNPKVLVRIAPALIIQAIQYSIAPQKIDKDALMSGVSYFTGPLLNWTLVGVIKALVKDIQQKQ